MNTKTISMFAVWMIIFYISVLSTVMDFNINHIFEISLEVGNRNLSSPNQIIIDYFITAVSHKVKSQYEQITSIILDTKPHNTQAWAGLFKASVRSGNS